MSEPFVGEIVMFGGNFAPRGWALCDGQLLAISQNTALFSILGTTYGGDGRTTFGLPDLRGRVPMHPGAGPGLTTRRLGERAGAETVRLTISEVPPQPVNSGLGDQQSPGGHYPAASSAAVGNFAATATPGATLAGGGGSQHNNMQPYVGVNFIIALVGTFPSRT